MRTLGGGIINHKVSKKILGIFFAIVLIAFIGSIFVNAQTFNPHKKKDEDKFLTDEQLNEIIKMKYELIEQGATDEEIIEAVYEKMKSYSIDISEEYDKKTYDKKSIYSELTDEQYEELKQMKTELKENGATTDEIIDAVNQKMKSYGYSID